jgi:hypothetical protein
VDVFGVHKASFAVLCRESSPVESFTVDNVLNAFNLRIRTRADVPMHTLRGYRLRGLYYGIGDTPLEEQALELADIAAGAEIGVDLKFRQAGVPLYVAFDIFRPTGFSAYSLIWKP